MGLADNDQTRMTRHQLAERIDQMKATAQRNSTIGAPRDRHRPMEDRRRQEKIATYERELERRIAADASQAEADARVQARTVDARAAEIAAAHGPAAAAGYRSVADASQAAAYKPEPMRPPLCAECASTGRTAYACTGLQTDHPLCARHGARAAAARHAAAAEQPAQAAATPAATEETTTVIEPGDFARAADEWREESWRQQAADAPDPYDDGKAKRQWEADQENADQAPPCECRRTGDTDDASDCPAHGEQRWTVHAPAPVIAAPPDPRLSIPCPQCHAAIDARCTNYTGKPCAPHGARKLERSPAARLARHDAKAASEKRAQVVADAHAKTAAEIAAARPTPTPAKTIEETEAEALAQTVEALVKHYTCGSVIDAAWAASARLFKAGQRRA